MIEDPNRLFNVAPVLVYVPSSLGVKLRGLPNEHTTR